MCSRCLMLWKWNHPVDLHVRQERHDDLLGQRAELGFDLGDEGGQDGRGLLLDAAAEAQVQGLDDGAAADAEEVAEDWTMAPPRMRRKLPKASLASSTSENTSALVSAAEVMMDFA